MRKKSKIALELASVNEKLDNLGQEKANKLNALKEAWAHLQNQLFEEKNIQQEIYAKKKKRNKSVSMPAKHSMRQRCKKNCIPKVPIPNVYKISPTNWDKLKQELSFIKKHATLIIEYQKDKRDLIEHIPTWKYQEEDLRKQLKKDGIP